MTGHDDLPLPDYDHLPVPSLAQRVRTLDTAGVQTLLDYENEHGHRLPVTQVLEARLAELARGAEPSGGDPAGLAPEGGAAAPAPRSTSMSTDAPPQNPPSHGDPTNPAQPRS